MLSDVSQWTVHDGVTCEGVSEPPKLNIPLFKPQEINEASATHIFYVNLAEKFQILPFIGSHERGVTCNGVSEHPMLNIHFSVQHLGGKRCPYIGPSITNNIVIRQLFPKVLISGVY